MIPGWGAKIPHASGPKSQNIKQKQYCNKLNKDLRKKTPDNYFKMVLLYERKLEKYQFMLQLLFNIKVLKNVLGAEGTLWDDSVLYLNSSYIHIRTLRTIDLNGFILFCLNFYSIKFEKEECYCNKIGIQLISIK